MATRDDPPAIRDASEQPERWRFVAALSPGGYRFEKTLADGTPMRVDVPADADGRPTLALARLEQVGLSHYAARHQGSDELERTIGGMVDELRGRNAAVAIAAGFTPGHVVRGRRSRPSQWSDESLADLVATVLAREAAGESRPDNLSDVPPWNRSVHSVRRAQELLDEAEDRGLVHVIRERGRRRRYEPPDLAA